MAGAGDTVTRMMCGREASAAWLSFESNYRIECYTFKAKYHQLRLLRSYSAQMAVGTISFLRQKLERTSPYQFCGIAGLGSLDTLQVEMDAPIGQRKGTWN